jgi:N-acetylglucosamine-6-phosphate deacetylase
VGVIRVGNAADLVLLDRDLGIQAVFVDGQKQ